MRIALENVAIEKACKLITEEELGRLWVAAKEFEKTKAEGNLVRLAEADVAFHEIIYQASDNKRLNQVLNNLREQMYRYRVEYLKEEQTRNLLVSEHEELVKAIREGDVQKAQDISFHHLENQRMAIIRTIRAENAARESEKKNKNRISGDIKRDATGISFLLEKDGEAVEEKRFQYLSMKMNLISGSAVKTAMIF